jgi:hypothetical protein
VSDALLRRVERTAMVIAGLAVAVAVLVPGGGAEPAAGVAGGALLAGASYWAIKRGIGGLADGVVARGTVGRSGLRGVLLFALRYALLAGLAYVMIARLRLPPIALLIGASTVVGAIIVELIRGMGRPGRG